jgi:hypothetical protein
VNMFLFSNASGTSKVQRTSTLVWITAFQSCTTKKNHSQTVIIVLTVNFTYSSVSVHRCTCFMWKMIYMYIHISSGMWNCAQYTLINPD